MAKGKLEGEIIVFGPKGREVFPKTAWDNLSTRRKAVYSVAGEKGVIEEGKIPIEQHSISAKTQKIEIQEVKVEKKLKIEPIEEVSEPIADEPKETSKKTPRAVMKKWFEENTTKGYYVKMPNAKMEALYLKNYENRK